MTLDEAIEHAREVERTCEDTRCAKDHAQLADWLRELRQVRIDIEVLKIFRDGFKEDAKKYKAENERLKSRLTIYMADAETWHAQWVAAYESNAKLRKLVAKAHACKTDDGCCEDCYQDEGCCPIGREMRELGIEVNNG